MKQIKSISRICITLFLSHCFTPPHGNRLLRWRLSRGTARSRTEQRKSPGAAARPREAYVGRLTPGKDYYVGTGGVQRGQTSMGRTRLPPLALFASFSGARKKMQHYRLKTKE